MYITATAKFAKRQHDLIRGTDPFLYDATSVEPVDNVEYEEMPINIHDIRSMKDTLSLDKEGFQILNLETKLQYEDFFDKAKVKNIFVEELRVELLKMLGAKGIYFHETVIRARHPHYPAKIPHSDFKYEQPIPRAHVDYTVDQARWIVEEVSGLKLPADTRIRAINVWKPLKGPVQEWPLALCDARTINPHQDLAILKSIFPKGFLDGHVVFHEAKHQWNYISDQKPSELWVFNTADTQGQPPVAHCSFELPRSPLVHELRESIEFRIFVVY